MTDAPLKRLSHEFLTLALLCRQRSFTYTELTEAIGSRSHALSTLLLAMPFLLPIPLPGLSQVLGVMILIAGMELSFNIRPWLPRKILRQHLPVQLLARLFFISAKVMRKIERFIHPRNRFLHDNRWVHRVNGACIALSGFLLALPLPPGTNFPPALVIVTLSIAILEDDIWFMIVGYLLLALMLVASFLVAVFGWQGVQALWHGLWSWSSAWLN